MTSSLSDRQPRPLPRHVAVIGAAGGLGQGILTVCRAEGIGFTAIVRSRPERITNLPKDSRVVVVESLADRTALTEAFSGADAVLTATGITSTSLGSSALLSVNMPTIEASMQALIASSSSTRCSPPFQGSQRAGSCVSSLGCPAQWAKGLVNYKQRLMPLVTVRFLHYVGLSSAPG
jgi:NAD(P)-dependent dehydrogenase (short-subunit alcohol dehydrogenase family)